MLHQGALSWTQYKVEKGRSREFGSRTWLQLCNVAPHVKNRFPREVVYVHRQSHCRLDRISLSDFAVDEIRNLAICHALRSVSSATKLNYELPLRERRFDVE